MEKALSFNNNPGNYDAYRPRYCPELFGAVMDYAKPSAGKTAVEIGCGTGLATAPFLETGCFVHAVEYGKDLAGYTADKFKAYDNFKVHHMAFEAYECEQNSVDLVYSATAFHWIDEETGYTKAYHMLKPGGALALFWNNPFPDSRDRQTNDDIQAVYQKFREYGNWSEPRTTTDFNAQVQRNLEKIAQYGFVSIESHVFESGRTFTADDYICLLETYSDHALLPKDIKAEFYADIHAAIHENGGFVRLWDKMDLYLAKKP